MRFDFILEDVWDFLASRTPSRGEDSLLMKADGSKVCRLLRGAKRAEESLWAFY